MAIKAKTAQGSTALAPSALNQDDFTALLQQSGLVETSTSEFHRIKIQGSTFYADDDILGVSNPKTGTPAFRAQLAGVPEEYQAMWFDQDGVLAAAIGRPHLAGTMCKSYFNEPSQAREYNQKGDSCRSCPVGVFVKPSDLPEEANGMKCKWKGDFSLRLVDEDGTISDPTLYTLSLPTTGMIEFKGTSREPVKGSHSELNFMNKLVRFGAAQNPENEKAGAAAALTALSLGGVIVDVHADPVQASNGNRYYVTRFEPVAIVDVTENPALPSGTDDADAVPF